VPNILTHEKVSRVSNAVAAGTTAVNCTSVDMAGFDSVAFYAAFGTLSATQVTSLKAQDSADNSTFADITGAVTANMADADSNKLLVLEVYRPLRRYVRAVVQRATANAVVDSVTAVQRSAKKLPPTNDTTVSASKTTVGV
jgi:hypothetical protein